MIAARNLAKAWLLLVGFCLVLTAYCYVDEVAHIELNGHILVPLQNIASLHCSSRCDAPQNDDWPPRGLLDDDGPGGPGPEA